MFDSSKSFNIPTIDGKRCRVRFPTDQEWCDRARKQKLIRRDLGRGKSQYDPARTKQIDADLFARIREDEDGPEFDQHEAAYVIDRLDRATVQSVERNANEYTITLRVPGEKGGVNTVHVLRVPSQKQADDYADASAPPPIHGERVTELRVFLEPAGPLYDAVLVRNEGYAGAVPIIHKLAAVTAMLRDVQSRTEEDDPEE